MFKNKLLRIFWISLVGAIISDIITVISVRMIMNGGNEWTPEMGNVVNTILLVFVIVYIVVTGIFLLKDMTRKEVFISALIYFGYQAVYLVIEQVCLKYGFGYGLVAILSIPFGLYSNLTIWIMNLFGDLSIWYAVISAMFVPMVYCLFGRSEKNNA